MKKFIIMLFFFTFLNACSKEKFEHNGRYFAEFNGEFEYNSETIEYSATIEVVLKNETKTSIEYNEIEMTKDGRKIKGELPELTLSNSSIVYLELKRNLFNTDIEGTFTTTIGYGGADFEFHPSEGTVILEATF